MTIILNKILFLKLIINTFIFFHLILCYIIFILLNFNFGYFKFYFRKITE